MEIIIEDNLLFKEAMRQMEKQWFLQERRDGERGVAFAKRINTTRVTINRVLGINSVHRKTSHRIQDMCRCEFCNTNEDLQVHHVYGRKVNETTYLCIHCHRKFHLLERRFNRRQKQ